MNTPETKFVLDISKPKKDFDTHLSLSFNERIIFSGGFGTGKTYFLNEYFRDSAKYDVIHLYPVNYSIASNQDIMELMKYDIGFELLRKDVDLKQVSFDKLFTFQFFIQNKFNDIFNIVLENAAKAGKSILPIGEALVGMKKKFEELAKEFDEFHEKSSTDQEKELLKYLKNFAGREGSLYEEDNITILIRELIGQLKSTKKETVLIIDDLDRIDPEHIFRLLNVFSAHFDINRLGNKFGFDKIILVCDIENIRNIFQAKYGMKVDFTGYIDKFYSKEIFMFDNLQVLADSITKLFASIELNEEHASLLKLKEPDTRLTNEMHYILRGMVHANAINLRSLRKLYKTQYKIRSYKISYESKNKFSTELPPIVIFNFLKFVLGNDIALSNALQKCTLMTQSQLEYIDSLDQLNADKLGSLILILDINQHELNVSDDVKTYLTDDNYRVTYKIQRDNSARGGVWAFVVKSELPKGIKYFKLLHETYQKLVSLNMLK